MKILNRLIFNISIIDILLSIYFIKKSQESKKIITLILKNK